MWLQYGFDERWADAFVDEADYRDAWAHHRDKLLQSCGPGRRPIAWWINEGPCRYPGRDAERRFLFEHNLLGGEERAALLADWRHAFERGHRWADVPSSLWEQWEAQRRDGTSCHRPEVETAEPPVPAAL
jgi:hypothetical protein